MTDPDPFDAAAARRFGTASRILARALAAITVDEARLEGHVQMRDPYGAAGTADLSACARILREELAPVLAAQYQAPVTEDALMAKDARLSFSFRLTVPEAIAWAEQQVGRLIVEIDAATRDAIRALVVRALSEGGPPVAVARVIRGMIGLHSRWAVAVFNRQLALERAGWSAARVSRETSRYYAQLLKTRSETIARTEIMKAANEGRAESWRQARSQGLLPANPMKQWMAASGAEENCAALDGTQVPMDDTFAGGAFGDVDMPPLHPGCRCVAILVVGAREMAEL